MQPFATGGWALSASVAASVAARSASRAADDGAVFVVVAVDGLLCLIAQAEKRTANCWLACLGSGAVQGLRRGTRDGIRGIVYMVVFNRMYVQRNKHFTRRMR